MQSLAWTVLVVFFLIILFVYAVKAFRAPKEPEQHLVGSIENVLTATSGPTAIVAGALDSDSRRAILYHVTSQEDLGTARRGEKDGDYFLDVLSPLPPIDREALFYEVWLVRPIPFHFISAGEMVTNDLAEFVLEFEGDRGVDYSAYNKVIITLETKAASPDPEIHIAEGEFKD